MASLDIIKRTLASIYLTKVFKIQFLEYFEKEFKSKSN